MRELRDACALVAERAASVRVRHEAIAAYAATLPLGAAALRDGAVAGDDALQPEMGGREQRAAYWLALDAVNFGSGWFPTLRKRDGRSGYRTIEHGLRTRATRVGPWTAAELERIDARELSVVLDQEPAHPLLPLFTRSLRDLGGHVDGEYGGSFAAVADAAGGSAVGLALRLGGWECFADCSRYGELRVPFLKRAQIAAADLDRAGVTTFADMARLTMFADNLVPHVLRLDGVLHFAPALVARIQAGELIEHGSPEEVEIRACALHAVELIVGVRGDTLAADVDRLLWDRGQAPRYKASPRHRSRCTAY
jgi:hypothetical protein